MNRDTYIPVALFGLLMLGLIGWIGALDSREGHAWCDGAALTLHRPVSGCMGAWNQAGEAGVRQWAQEPPRG